MTRVSFTVHGLPAPQGGSRAVNTPGGARLITTGGVNLKNWRTDCAAVARAQADLVGCITEAVVVIAEFRHPMPKSRRKAQRDAGTIVKTTAPDLDKLQRALGDALTAGGLLGDDALIVQWRASKVEVWQQWTGVAVVVKTLDDPNGWTS